MEVSKRGFIKALFLIIILVAALSIFSFALNDNKGAVSTIEGTTPFYTNGSNPVSLSNFSCLENMSDGDSCVVEWYVNATDTTGETYSFFSTAESENYSIIGQSSKLNITVLAIPLTYQFSTSYGTTNFSSIVDLTSVQNLTLANAYGRIKFPETYSVNAENESYDDNVKIGWGVVSVDTTSLHPSFNYSVNLTFENVSCPPVIYVSPSFYPTSDEVFENGFVCDEITEPACSVISCIDGTLLLNVSHFTSYAAGLDSNLTIYDDTDPEGGSAQKNPYDDVTFFANYTMTNGSFISGANCTIWFDDSQTWYNLTETSSVYEYTRYFEALGDHGWNVSCNKTGYDNLTTNDTVSITSLSELNCSVVFGGCSPGYVDVMHMSDLTDAHAELPNGTEYDYAVCCNDAKGAVNFTNSSGVNIVDLSSETNAHAEIPGTTDYEHDVYIGSLDSQYSVICSYETGGCSSGECLMTLSTSLSDGNTDLHVADCITDPYDTHVCCEMDNYNPNITIITPIEDDILGWTVLLRANVTDDNLDSVWYELKNESGDVIDSGDMNNYAGNLFNGTLYTNDTWPYDTSLKNSTNLTFIVYANDTTAHTFQRNTTWVLDNTKPSVQYVNPPQDGMFVNSNFSLEIFLANHLLNYSFYNITNSTGDNVSYNQSTLSSATFIWDDNVDVDSLPDGNYTILTYANDASNETNENSKTTWFYVDKTEPSVSTDWIAPTPDNASIFVGTELVMNFTCNDSFLSNVWIDLNETLNTSLGNSGDAYWWVQNLTDGDYEFTGYCNDTSGNIVSTELRYVTIKNSGLNVTLISPEDNSTIFNRTPLFNWYNATDGRGSTQYELVVSTDEEFSSIIINATDITETEHNTSWQSNITLDVDQVYYWKVRGYDNDGIGEYSDVWNFTLQSYIMISLPVDTVEFGDLNMTGEENTSDYDPWPLIVQNDGNVEVDIILNATHMWDSVQNPTPYFLYKIDWNETGAFNYSNSTTSWTQVPYVNNLVDVRQLGWSNMNDSCEIDLYVATPVDEPPGVKSSIITLYAEASS